MPYAELQSMIDDPPGFRQYWSADYHDTFPDEALDVFLAAGASRAVAADPAPAAALGRRAGAAIADDCHPVDPARGRAG